MAPQAQTTVVRFSVEATQRARADAVCHKLGFDLHDVLRALVRRIATDRAIPFDLAAYPATLEKAPFSEPTPFLVEDLGHLQAEVTLGMLSRFIATWSRRIADERGAARPDKTAIARWTAELEEALEAHRTLDIADREQVAHLAATFRARLSEVD